MKTSIAGFVCCALVGCGSPFLEKVNQDCATDCKDGHGTTILSYNEADFSPEETERLKSSAAKWNAFAGREVIAYEPMKGPPTMMCSIVKDPPGSGAVGTTRRRSIVIHVRKDWYCNNPNYLPGYDCFESLIMHETGHALDFEHVDSKMSVMFKETWVMNFSPDDRAECERLGYCR